MGAGRPVPPIAETKSEGSVLTHVDVNIECFESKSSFERANSFIIKPEPKNFEWVSIGHGRFVKRELSTNLDPDFISHEFDSDYVDL